MKAMTLQESQIAIDIPGLSESLYLRSVTGNEEVGRLFEYDLEILCDSHDIKHLDVLGQNATVSLYVPNANPRYINGHVAAFTYAGTHSYKGAQGGQETYARYRATLRPWLWFLTRRTDCRIYQNQSVSDIIAATVARHGFTAAMRDDTTGTYAAREYCVQYRETDCDFVTRLMEQEGIYYYYEHTDGAHTVVLVDGDGNQGSQPPVSGYEEIEYHIYDPTVERIYQWSISQQVEPTAVGLEDFNFETPKSYMSAAVPAHSQYVSPHIPSTEDLEAFDYPGKYDTADAGDSYARMRMEAFEAQYEVGTGETNARMLLVGGRFILKGHQDRAEENREYMVLAAYVEMHWAVDESNATPPDTFTCRFHAMDITRPYRLPRLTPRPVVQGPQTAIVVGPSGEKIYPDNYGRVKVQFHWDRYGQKNESSSCWIRVSQVWAGLSFGAMHIPHIGQEVIVEFLEGDPDRPIITGRVYNAANMPQYALPAEKYRSVLRDEYGNEIVFNSTPGNEGIWLYSPNGNTSLQLGGNRPGSATDWDQDTVIIGTKTDWVLGAQHVTNLVTKSDFLVGFGTDIKVGGVFEAKVGYTTSLKADSEYSVNLFDDRNLSLDDYHQEARDVALIDSHNILQHVGGKQQESRIKMDSSELAIERLQGKARLGHPLNDAKVKSIKVQLAVLTGLITAASTTHAVAAPFAAKKDQRTQGHRSGWWAAAIGAIHAIASLWSAKLHWQMWKGADVDILQHATDTSAKLTRVVLDDKKVELTADKNTITLSNSQLRVGTQKSNGKVMIESGSGYIMLSSTNKVLLRTKRVVATNGLKTKNIADQG